MILQNYTGRNTDEVSRIVGELVGTVVIKSLFNGYGIFKDSHMFAIYRNNVVYIRSWVGELAKLILQLEVFLIHTSPSNMYFYLPKEITEDKQKISFIDITFYRTSQTGKAAN
ncbi:TfoX/Sxy family protein [Gallibacterium anatis]|uniref:TfoX/Sxy family protein n=1 Tax=Gallibacterium anatis TaxID=750 RepID=A0A930YAS1_9PAST|nr:TfoX/Sxy family protein [Gallibacterium anatis]